MDKFFNWIKEYLLGIYETNVVEVEVLSDPVQIEGGWQYPVKINGDWYINSYFFWIKYKYEKVK